MESVKWYQSRVIWAALVSALSGLLNLVGKQIDPALQGTLADWITQGVTIATAFFAAYGRTTTTAVIAGGAGEKSLMASGTSVTPKVN